MKKNHAIINHCLIQFKGNKMILEFRNRFNILHAMFSGEVTNNISNK